MSLAVTCQTDLLHKYSILHQHITWNSLHKVNIIHLCLAEKLFIFTFLSVPWWWLNPNIVSHHSIDVAIIHFSLLASLRQIVLLSVCSLSIWCSDQLHKLIQVNIPLSPIDQEQFLEDGCIDTVYCQVMGRKTTLWKIKSFWHLRNLMCERFNLIHHISIWYSIRVSV